MRWRLMAWLAATVIPGSVVSAPAEVQLVFPPLDRPNMLFGDGAVASGKPTFFQPATTIGGAPSAWKLLQWRQSEYLNPSKVSSPSEGAYDWKTPTGNLELRVSKGVNGYIYQMRQSGGVVQSSGATDLFLAATPSVADLRLDRTLSLDVVAKVTQADIEYSDAYARSSGAVLAQLGANFRLRYVDPEDRKVLSVMVGIPISTSRDIPPTHMGCHYFGAKRAPQIVSVQSLPGDRMLKFAVGQTQHLSYDLNKLVCAAVRRQFACKNDEGASTSFSWPKQASDLRNWFVDGMTIGVETQDHFEKDGVQPIGRVNAGLEISDLKVVRSADAPMNCSRAIR